MMIIMIKNKNQKGFGLVEFSLILLVAIVIGIVGYYVYRRYNPSYSKDNSSTVNTELNNKDVFNVVSYGADPSGQKDSSVAIQTAVNAAEKAESVDNKMQTVYFPDGTYILDDIQAPGPSIVINSPYIQIEGQNQTQTKVIEEVGNAKIVNNQPGKYPNLKQGKDVFVFTKNANYAVFNNLTVDARTYNAGTALHDSANHTLIENSTFLGANNGTGGAGTSSNPSIHNVFDLQLGTVCNANPSRSNYFGKVFRSDNVVSNVTVIGGGQGGNDDLDLSCQNNDQISNIHDNGWGIGMYLDQNMTINGDQYSFSNNKLPHFGWYITDGHNITINNFTTQGPGGYISSPNYPSSNITINQEKMTQSGYALVVVDVNNLKINNSELYTLSLTPSIQGSNGINGLIVSNSTIQRVTCQKKSGLPISGLSGVSCPASL